MPRTSSLRQFSPAQEGNPRTMTLNRRVSPTSRIGITQGGKASPVQSVSFPQQVIPKSGIPKSASCYSSFPKQQQGRPGTRPQERSPQPQAQLVPPRSDPSSPQPQ